MKMFQSMMPLIVAALPSLCLAANTNQLTVRAINKLPIARNSQTIELSATQLAPLGVSDLQRVHVFDAAGKEVLAQAVDTNLDEFHKADIVIFQANFGPGEERSFTVSAGARQEFTKEQFHAYGRFVRERFDDFAWENDRIAHRMYGKALETWKGEPLTSSTVDIWTKRVPYMVIDGWYMSANYHADHGEGADFYSAGKTRGCGGNGLWADEKLWNSKNFVESRQFANGPIRVLFELVYESFDVNGKKVSEVKRISLDAGSNMDHFQSTYTTEDSDALVSGIGLRKMEGEKVKFNPQQGWLLAWEDVEKKEGKQGVAIVVDPKSLVKKTEDKTNNLLLVNVNSDKTLSYWAGFGWDRSGQFADADAWKTYVEQFSEGLRSPIEVTVTAE